MKVPRSIFLVVFAIVVACQVKDASAAVTDLASGLIKNIVKLPLSIAKQVLKIPLKPFSLLTPVVKELVQIVLKIQNINAKMVSEIIVIVKQVIAEIVEILVNVGVLQGKTTEEIINSVKNIVTNVVAFGLSVEMKISSTIVDTIEKLISGLNIKQIINKFINLPIVKQIAMLVNKFKRFIQENFQTQIDDIKTLIQTQFLEHRDFFQPILDGISSRILIISNALHALVNGDLNACPGETNPDMSPTGSLQAQLNKLIDQIKVGIFSFLGLTGLANKYQLKIDGTTSPPFGSITWPSR